MMKSIKLLFLSSVLFWACFQQVHGLSFKVVGFNGTFAKGFFKLPPQTRDFEIGCNHIKHIEAGAICTTSALETVTIDFTGTSEPPIPHADMFENCENLTALTLYGSKRHPTELKTGFWENFGNLKYFSTKNFIIRRLTKDFFTGLHSLTTLSLDKSAIREIDAGTFDGLEKLTYLSLDQNEIAVLPKNLFAKLSRVKILNLSDNRMSRITWETFDGLSSLSMLDLGFNRIGSLSTNEIDKYLPGLFSIRLEGNLMDSQAIDKFIDEAQAKMSFHGLGLYFSGGYDGSSCEGYLR